jgi:hypothetical protein
MVVFTNIAIISQDSLSISSKRKFNLTDISISSGFNNTQKNIPLSIETYQTLVPQSIILNSDLSDYRFYNSLLFSYNNFRTSMPLHIAIGFKLSDPTNSSKINISLRCGFSINKYSSNTTYGNKTKTVNYDTDTSIYGVTYYDSIFDDQVYMNFNGTYFQVDGALLVSTKTNSKFSFQTGMGFNLGTVFNSYVQIGNWQSIRLSKSQSGGSSSITRVSESESEIYKIKNGMLSQIYIPIGLNYRLSKKNDFLQKVELFSELRPNISFVKIAHLNTQINLSNSILLGCRVTW